MEIRVKWEINLTPEEKDALSTTLDLLEKVGQEVDEDSVIGPIGGEISCLELAEYLYDFISTFIVD